MSDWDGLAIPLTGKIDYTKTYLDKEPRLDLTHLTTDQRGRYDFVLCSEALEHVAPPIGQAFRGLIDLLRPGGSLLLTVPYQINADTIEHFPELCEYGLAQIGNSPVLVNKKRNGVFEVFDNLTFHGGVGSTLEMRIFGERDLLRNLEEVGFEQVAILGEDCPRYGIIHREQWSLPILAKKAESA